MHLPISLQTNDLLRYNIRSIKIYLTAHAASNVTSYRGLFVHS